MSRTLEQCRAEYARARIRELEGRQYGHYVSYVSALPATIVTNGLGQALTMLLAKSKNDRNKPHHLLFTHVAGWLAQRMPELGTDAQAVVDRLMENGQDVYVRAQMEAIAYLEWLKQFARAYLSEPEDSSDD